MRFLLSFLCVSTLLFADKPVILVSLAPYSNLVERIAKDTVIIKVIAPQNSDPHTFEPSIKSMEALNGASLWFCVGELFEKKIQRILKNEKLKIIDLRQNITGIKGDRHFWLSIPALKTQAQTITNALVAKYPHMKNLYESNLKALLKELEKLNDDIVNFLKTSETKAILVTHPAFVYFCKDYNLQQISLEQYGKEPTLKELEDIYRQAKEFKISTIIMQPQHPKRGAMQIAKKLNIKAIMFDPYDKNFMRTMKMLAQLIASGKNNK